MTTDLEAGLRREFDAASPPSSLSFGQEAVLRQGSRTVRRRRIMAAGSCTVAVALVATGASLLTRPENKAAPQPAVHTKTSGIVQADLDSYPLTARVEVNRDPRVRSNVQFVVITDKRRVVVGLASTARPGQKTDATWKSGMVAGHPFTYGLVPGTDFQVSLAAGASYGISSAEVKGTGYSAFSVQYKNGDDKEPARPAQIASITWAGPNGIVDGIEGDRRLSGQILGLDSSVSEKLVLRPGKDGRTTVSGEARLKTSNGGYSTPQAVVTTDAFGVAVTTSRYPVERRMPVDAAGRQAGWYIGYDGAPIAAGILPPGASNIGVLLTRGKALNPVVVLKTLSDGRVTFAVKAESAHPVRPSKDSIRAVTWTNADGSTGRQNVTQENRPELLP
jgi:hypothetical protein